MAWLRRGRGKFGAAGAVVAVLAAFGPSAPEAQANVACDIGVGQRAPITGAIGIGNPIGDVCESVSDRVLSRLPNPLGPIKDAAGSIGEGVFEEITSWAADGAVWLLGRVVGVASETTTPNLLGKGFVRQYRDMTSIAALMALVMLLLVVLESLGRGEPGMLLRVLLVHLPIAAVATSAAYVVVQLLIVATDGFSAAVAESTGDDLRRFFKDAIKALGASGAEHGTAATGPGAGTAVGAVVVPLFVSFIVAIIAAFAAFCLWIELLMRDAAIYAVSLFLPLSLAASIWPRWVSALRRTAELLVVVIASKFVIVSILALSASLLANTGGKVEQVLAAGALLLLACFAPIVLFRLVPFAEGAISSALQRQGGGRAPLRTVELASSVQMMRRAALGNWAASETRANGHSGGGRSRSNVWGEGAAKQPSGGRGAGSSGASGSRGSGASGAAAGAAAPVTAGQAQGIQATGEAAARLASSGAAQASGGTVADGAGSDGGRQIEPMAGRASTEGSARPSTGKSRAARPRAEGGEASASQTTSSPVPAEAPGGKPPDVGAKAPRPSGDVSTGGADREAKS